jgi:hypothetical protein
MHPIEFQDFFFKKKISLARSIASPSSSILIGAFAMEPPLLAGTFSNSRMSSHFIYLPAHGSYSTDSIVVVSLHC